MPAYRVRVQIISREVITELKGRDMMVDRFAELFGLAAATAS